MGIEKKHLSMVGNWTFCMERTENMLMNLSLVKAGEESEPKTPSIGKVWKSSVIYNIKFRKFLEKNEGKFRFSY